MKFTVEVCANSIKSAINANEGNADRIELCQDLQNGGTTPSYSAIKFCCEKLPFKTAVLIRPRSGNFIYSNIEFEAIKEDILICKSLAVEAVVVGFLLENNNIDVKKLREIVKLSSPVNVVFHRAFDLTYNNWKNALESIIDCGCSRLLTSGFAPNVELGMSNLEKIALQANNRIEIVAGSGVNSTNIEKIYKNTGITQFHLSAKKKITGLPNNIDLAFSNYYESSSEEIMKIRAILTNLS